MINKSLSKEEIKKLLFESEVIGQGTYGLIVKYDEDTLLKIYYKNIFHTFYSKNIEKLDGEINSRIETENEMIQMGLICKTRLEDMISRIQQLENTKSRGLIKGIAMYKECMIGVFLERYKNYDTLTNVFSDLQKADQKRVLDVTASLLVDLYKNGVAPLDIKEDNVMVRKKDLDVKLIDLDGNETRYEDKKYLDEFPYIKKDVINLFEKMKDRLEKINVQER